MSFLKKHYPTHTHPLISICEFLKLYELLTHPTPPLHELHDPLHLYMTHPTPHLHDPPHPCMTHPTLHDPPHPCMTHPTPAWPTQPLYDTPTPAWPTPTLLGGTFGRHAALQLIMVQETFPHSYTSPHIHFWNFGTLRLIISWVWVICKRLNVNWKKIHSIILSVTCYSLRNFPPLIPMPSYPFINFKTLWLIISWVWVICKRLNVNWKKIHSIILSVFCHSLRNFPPLIHMPSYPFMNFWIPRIIISWVWVIHKMLKINCTEIHNFTVT